MSRQPLFQEMLLKNSKTRGSVLAFSIIVLSFIMLIVFSVFSLIIPRLAIIREVSNSVAAFYAADSIIEWCIYESRYSGDLTPPALNTIGATYTLNDSSPPFGTDHCPLDVAYSGQKAVGTFGGVSRALDLQTAPQ